MQSHFRIRQKQKILETHPSAYPVQPDIFVATPEKIHARGPAYPNAYVRNCLAHEGIMLVNLPMQPAHIDILVERNLQKHLTDNVSVTLFRCKSCLDTA